MPKTNWRGIISFGLVSIPVILFPTVNKSADISFHQIDRRNNARIKYQRINSETGKEVDWGNIIKGYEYDKNTTIPVPDDILKRIAGDNARTIEITEFINKKELDFITVDKSYFIAPDKKGDKGYVILREALMESNKIGIAKVIISTKEYLAAILPYENKGLVLCLLKYNNEMRDIKDISLPEKELSTYKITKREIEIAKQLIQSMTAKWKPEKYVDEYQETIHQWIKEAVNKSPHHAAMKSKAKAPSNVVDFADLLKKSLRTKSKNNKSHKTVKSTSTKKRKQARH